MLTQVKHLVQHILLNEKIIKLHMCCLELCIIHPNSYLVATMC